ncbi:hypothetical protein [Streptomyces scopuliridis]|uniref:hypothetical protein n=1 Tax=Streptomyces scopuliridis TaxID=452529 RepID=UPI00343F5DFC
MTTEAYAESWRQLIDLAGQERGNAANARMSLASAGGSSNAAADGDLKHTDRPWTTAAGVAEALRTSTATAKSKLSSAHAGVAAGNEGLASASVLTSVLTSWEDRLGTVREECGSLAPKLRLVGKELGERDVTVKSSLQGIDTGIGASSDPGEQ